MAADQLARHAVGDVRPVALAELVAEQREERGLEEQVAELVDQLGRRPRLARRLGDLVRLLERVRHDRLDGLRAIPRALAAQRCRQLEQLHRRLPGRTLCEPLPRGRRLGVVLRAPARARGGRAPRRVAASATSSMPCAASAAASAGAPSSSCTGRRAPQRLDRRERQLVGVTGAERDDELDPQRALPGAGRAGAGAHRGRRVARSRTRSSSRDRP